jgi:predicted nucleotide-binding protein (sugar kinase/HSP70/actin superfamily)
MAASGGEGRMDRKASGGPVTTSTETAIKEQLERERARLAQELGIEDSARRHHERPAEHPFVASQRPHTTVLYGGLTWKHERLIHGALLGLGYKPEALPVPDVAAFQAGKEYGNNGQCNPTYFTVGNLVRFLQDLEMRGMSREEIIDRYVFVTAGACGPCRFGMYEAEYRLALRNSGFDGFRVLLFQQSGGLNQAGEADGLELNADFFLAFINALNMGDVLNDVGYQMRPFEVEPGSTDAAMDRAMETLHEVFRAHRNHLLEGRVGALLKALPVGGGVAQTAGKFADQLLGSEYVGALDRVAEELRAVRVDRTRVKPLVKITGEFWAQTTEGDGNYNMFAFLEREGAQVLVEPVGTWIMYMIHQAKQATLDRAGMDDDEAMPSPWRIDKRTAAQIRARRKNAKLSLAEAVFTREWNRLRKALGDVPHELTDQYELQRIAHPMYNSRAGGGEGHLEVAKNIYYSNRDMCHMVLSLKPFGCMPSTQSDGVQSAVVNQYKDMVYLPIETSGEGEINAHSRVQMALGEAKVKAREEIDRVLAETGRTLDEVRAYAEEHPRLQDPLYKIPHHEGVVGTAANFVMHVDGLIREGSHARAAVPAGTGA